MQSTNIYLYTRIIYSKIIKKDLRHIHQRLILRGVTKGYSIKKGGGGFWYPLQTKLGFFRPPQTTPLGHKSVFYPPRTVFMLTTPSDSFIQFDPLNGNRPATLYIIPLSMV